MKVLDEAGLYAYKNDTMKVGILNTIYVIWISVKLMYPYIKMPDPKAGLRLTKLGCEVKFEDYSKEANLTKIEDLDEDGKT